MQSIHTLSRFPEIVITHIGSADLRGELTQGSKRAGARATLNPRVRSGPFQRVRVCRLSGAAFEADSSGLSHRESPDGPQDTRHALMADPMAFCLHDLGDGPQRLSLDP